MKTRIFYFPLLALIFLFTLSCSKDDLDDPSDATRSLNNSVQKKSLNFDFKEVGNFEWSSQVNCDQNGKFFLSGEMEESSLGILTTKMLICTDYGQLFYIKGVQTSASGDELHFSAQELTKDAQGYWMLFNYEGGTGEFRNATGQVKVRTTQGFQGDEHGLYMFFGKGTVNM